MKQPDPASEPDSTTPLSVSGVGSSELPIGAGVELPHIPAISAVLAESLSRYRGTLASLAELQKSSSFHFLPPAERPGLLEMLERPTSLAEQQLTRDIAKLKGQLAKERQAALEAQERRGEAESEVKDLRKTMDLLHQRERLSFVITRVHESAVPYLLDPSSSLQGRFLADTTCKAFVMAVDIRRSTDLMLKARTPKQFAEFLTTLCTGLRKVVLDNYGIFDKFTGDGILAFFPDFYSGKDAGLRAVQAAHDCHQAFQNHYASSRSCFKSVIKDIGLGIGIDFGAADLVQVGDGLTVVGEPVVYACRMSDRCEAGLTLLNQPSYEELLRDHSGYCSFADAEFDAKHEGRHIAYAVSRNGKSLALHDPDWMAPASSQP